MSKRDRHLWTLCSVMAILFCAPVTTAAHANESWENATHLYQSHQWQQAATAFDRLASDSQQNSTTRQNARLYAGEALMQLGQYAEAVRRYHLAQQWGLPERLAAQVPFRLGEAAWLAGNTQVAAKQLEAYLEKYPHGESVAYAREYLTKIQTHQSAEQDFALLDEAVGWQREGRHDAALAAYDELLRQPIGGAVRAEALRRAAKLHQELAHSSEALALYEKFLAEYPNSERAAEVLLSVAQLSERLDQSAQAADHFRAVVAKFPQSAQAADATYWLALTHADEEKTGESMQYLDRLLTRSNFPVDRPELFGQALCLKCQLLSAQDQWAQIGKLVEVSRAQLREGPLKTKLDFWAAEAAFRLREYKQAGAKFADLQLSTIGIDEPWTAMVPLRRAQLAARKQQWSEVLKILNKLVRDFPQFELDYEVDYLRGRALAGRGEMTAARRNYRRVLDNKAAAGTEAAVMAGWMTGETFFHQRDYPRARDAYENVMLQTSMPQWQSRAALQAGKCWELESKWEQAQRVYAQALERLPNSDSDQELQSRLRWAQSHIETRRQVTRK